MKMTGNFTKSYEQILEEQKTGTSKELIKVTPDTTAIIRAGSVTDMIKLAHEMIPDLNKKMIGDTEGLPAVFQEKWLATVDEALHSMETVPQRRTLTEKKLAVLQTNRHPTASAKFHQAKLEQASYTGQLVDLQFSYQDSKIKMEERLYKFEKNMEKLKRKQEAGDDTFLLEKKLEREKIALVKMAMDLAGTQNRMQNIREEIAEWTDIKALLYQEAEQAGEFWSPNTIDGEEGYQEISLVLRHFQNFIMQVQQGDGGDISSVLNIQGLCLTAFEDGLKSNKLGLYLAKLPDSHIILMWKKLYGIDIVVERGDGFLVIRRDDTNVLVLPTSIANWKKMQERV